MLLSGLRDEAKLTQMGTWAALTRCVQSLARRRRLSRLLRTHPEIREVAVPAPVVIVGFPRSGTTALQNMLAANPGHRAIRTWEMREPFAPEDAPDDWQEQTEKTTHGIIQARRKMSPQMDDIHPLNAAWPHECSWLFRNSFATLGDSFMNYLPTYADWLMNRDMDADYGYYRLQLQAILFQRPGAPLILKDPCHTWHLTALLRALPDARVIQLHRDVRDVASSFASLCRALQQGTSEHRSDENIGEYAARMLEVGMNNMLAARRELADSNFFDVSYKRFVADPVGMVAELHERLDLSWSPEASDATTAWLTQSKKHTGRHRHDLAMFGLDADEIRTRFDPYFTTFAGYLQSR